MSDEVRAQPSLAEVEEAHSEPGERSEAGVREKLTKKASVVFQRKDSDGSSFWSLSARNSVVSMFESGAEASEDGESEAPRRLLQKKRSSLSRQPDIERSMEAAPVHEFQKVMSGLKRVEDQKMEMKKSSSATSLDPEQTASKEVSELESGKNQDKNGKGSIKRNSSDKKASDLNSKLKEDKSSSALKKKQVNKTGGKTPAQSSRPTVPPTTKRPLKPQQSAPARTQSLKTKKEANSDTSPVKSSGLQQKKVKPDTIAAHKNPTRSRSTSPPAGDKKCPPAPGGEKKPASRTMSLRSGRSQTKLESSEEVKRAASLRKQTSKPELSKTKSVGPVSPSKTVGGSDKKKKDEKEAGTKKIPPSAASKPNPEPLKKRSLGRGEEKKVPPPVAPKPGQRKLNLSLDLPNRKSKEQRPVVKKLLAKQSLAEIARLADSDALEIVVSETVHQTQFVSHAKAVLSPSPSRRVRPVTAQAEESDTETREEKEEEEEEGGIISESVSASSVIQMFGGVGKFKKTAPPSSGSSEKTQSPTEESAPVSKSRKNSEARKLSNNSPGTRKPSAEIRNKKSSTGGTGSTAAGAGGATTPRKKSSSVSGPAPVTKKSVPRKESKKSITKPTEEESASSTNVVKTTMTVRLQPANKEDHLQKEEEEVEQRQEKEVEERQEETESVPVKGGETESLCPSSMSVCSGPDKTRQ